MPLYDIEHVVPLSATQQESLAVAFTSLHSARFNVPRVFINVRFTDASRQVVFRGGRRVLYNRLILRTRASEKRGKDVYDAHCRDLITAWAKVVLGGDAEGDGSGGEELKKKELRTVWVLGALTTAVECGIARPRVGEEDEWLKTNMDEFRRLAAEGDEDFIELVQELDSSVANA